MSAAPVRDQGATIGRALRARTVSIDPTTPVDLLAVAGTDGWLWERDRAGLAGRGEARRIRLRAGLGQAGAVAQVMEELGAIQCCDEVGLPGCGPIAVGALPFDRDAPAELIVPEVVVGRAPDGRCWLTTVGTGPAADAPAILEALAPLAPEDPDGFALTSPIPHAEWMGLVAAAVGEIDAGVLDKVVLAREVRVDANRRIHVPTVLRRLRSLYPMCTVVSAEAGPPSGRPGRQGSPSAGPGPIVGGAGALPSGWIGAAGSDRFVAASPELLVSRDGDRVRSQPLAGTIPRSGDPGVDRALAEGLLGSAKDRAEHDWVVRDVERALAPWCSTMDVPDAPSIVSFRNVSHLGTLVEGRLAAAPGDRPSALALAAALHPTAAVGGAPRREALAWLIAHEQLERGPYAGPVGWVDARGDGEWVVGIRSAVISGSRARLFAGVGVVEGSDPAAELAETQFKLQALLAAVVRP